MSDLETKVKDEWASYIAAHGGHNVIPVAEINRSVSRKRDSKFKTDVPRAEWGDFERLERYIDNVGAANFTRDVSYQLYYVTECLIWLWKRLPREILLREEGKNEFDDRIRKLLKDLNVGTSTDELPQHDRNRIPDARQGTRLTPPNGEPIVKPVEFDGGVREVALTAMSHEPPPPPPGWPGE